MNIDTLMAMSSEELDTYLRQEVYKIIDAAPPENRNHLRAVHNRARLQVQAAKNPYDAMIRLNKLMWESFDELRSKVNEASEIVR